MTATNITQSARILGINKSTLILALKSFPATPVGMQSFRSSPVPVYDVEQIRECYDQYKAQVEANKRRALAADEERGWLECTRCGRIDTCNDVRDGLCLDCWCRDYNRDHPIRKEAIAGICESERANARDVAAKNDEMSKKTGNDRGNDETREKRAKNDVNERATQ